MTSDRTTYHREYMRQRRGTERCGPPRPYIKGGDPARRATTRAAYNAAYYEANTGRRAAYLEASKAARRKDAPRQPADDWLQRLRTLYPPFLRAQRQVNAFRSDTLRLTGADPAPPAHLLLTLTTTEAALDAHIALDPDRAAEYFERHDIARDQRQLHRLTATATGAAPKLKGRPRLTPALSRLPLAQALTAAAALRHDTYTAYTLALDRADTDAGAPPVREATRIQAAWDTAKRRHEAAAAKLDAHDALTARQADQQAAHERQQADALDQTGTLRTSIAARLAALPDPPRAPLHPQAHDPHDQTAQAKRRAAYIARRDPVPLTGDRYAELALRYTTATDPTTGATRVIRRATGRPVKALTVTCDDHRTVRTLDLLEALRPCGLA